MDGDKSTKLKSALLKLPRNELMTLLEDTYNAMKNKYGIKTRSETLGSPTNAFKSAIWDTINEVGSEKTANLNFSKFDNVNAKNIGNENPLVMGVPASNLASQKNKAMASMAMAGITKFNSNPIVNQDYIIDKGFNHNGKLSSSIPTSQCLKMANMQPMFHNRTVLKRKVMPKHHQKHLVQTLPPEAASFAPQNKL